MSPGPSLPIASQPRGLPLASGWHLSRARRTSIPLKAEMIHTINTPLLARAGFK